MKIANLILLIISPLVITACLDEPDCNSNTTNFVNVKFYDIEDNQPAPLFVKTVTLLEANITDSIDLEITTIQLPLNPHQRSTRFLFDTTLGLDTLELTYEINARLVSEDCGVETIFSELDYIQNGFESVQIVNRILVEEITEDVKIFN